MDGSGDRAGLAVVMLIAVLLTCLVLWIAKGIGDSAGALDVVREAGDAR